MRTDVPLLGHHPPVLFVLIAGDEVEPALLKSEPVMAGHLLQHAHFVGHHFLADAVGDDGDRPACVAEMIAMHPLCIRLILSSLGLQAFLIRLSS